MCAVSPCVFGAATRPRAAGGGPLGAEGGRMVSLWRFIFSWFTLKEEEKSNLKHADRKSDHRIKCVSVCVGCRADLTLESEAAFSFHACCLQWHCLYLHAPSQPSQSKETHRLNVHVNNFTTSLYSEWHYKTDTHLHLITVEEVDVGIVLVLVLTHEQQHRGVAGLIQHRLTHVDGGEREVLQFLLEE